MTGNIFLLALRFITTEMCGELPIPLWIGIAHLTPVRLPPPATCPRCLRRPSMNGPTTFSPSRAKRIPVENSQKSTPWRNTLALSRDRACAVPKAGWVPFFRNLVPVAPECHTFRHHGAYARIDRAGYIFGQDLQSRPAVSGQTPRLRPDA